MLTYSEAIATLDPTDLLDLYWSGRTTLVTRRDQIPTYDRGRSGASSSTSVSHCPSRGDRPPRPPSRPRRSADTRDRATPRRRRARRGGPARADRLGCPDLARQVVRRLHSRRVGGAATDHGSHPADAAAPLHPPNGRRRRRPPARPAPHRPRDDAHARRSGDAVLASSPDAHAAAGPDPRRVRLDVGLLAGLAAVRLLDASRRRPGSRSSASAPA